uniref:Cell cycle control protein 50A n=1 Tax=Parastrongyloides trichosuri TaxID=131310 RepID=A0A0N5A4A7_PARTI
MPSVVIPKVAKKSGLQNKPKESKWLQQSYPSYRPQYSFICTTSLILFIALGFLSVSILLKVNLDQMEEISIDYTDCYNDNESRIVELNDQYHWSYHGISLDAYNNTVCTYRLQLYTEIRGNITFQYSLHKFYQNWKSYFDDRSDYQLEGHPKEYKFSNCSKNYLQKIPWGVDGIIWPSDKSKKFINPKLTDGIDLCTAFANTSKPPNWTKRICELGDNITGYGFQNVDFMIWMKSAALPKFRKNYRSLSQTNKIFENGLPKGLYQLDITYLYNVENYDARKKFIISTRSILPSKNYFLLKAYTGVTSFLVSTAIIFGILELISKKL